MRRTGKSLKKTLKFGHALPQVCYVPVKIPQKPQHAKKQSRGKPLIQSFHVAMMVTRRNHVKRFSIISPP